MESKEIFKFCNDHLSYLRDIGILVMIQNDKYDRPESIKILSFNYDLIQYNRIKWIQIKDDFIPFLFILNDNYKTNDFLKFKSYTDRFLVEETYMIDENYPIDYILSENLPDTASFTSIEIKLTK